MIDYGIVNKVRALIEDASRETADDGWFTPLALAIAAEQGRLAGDTPTTGPREGLDRIEPVPETAFKMMTVAMFPPSEAVAEFLTSGTSSGTRGRLLVKDMELYRSSVIGGFRMFCMTGNPPRRFLSLIPPADARPSSSLSWMASFVMREFDSGHGEFAGADGRLDGEVILRAMEDSRASGQPLFIMGTSVDFMTLYEFLDSIPGRPIPAPGCRVMHTGGAKASGREITRSELIARAGDLFLAAPEDVIEEFGMTELFSQAYDSPRATPGPRRLVPVPWMKTRILDPRTLNDVAEGERGILVHYDLANVYTCLAMMAADTAVRIRDGFGDITRSIGAPARGCSNEAASGVRTGEGS